MGKTQFSSSLSPSNGCLELDCAGRTSPDLRLLDAFRHNTVLFDEASAALVHANKLFQARASYVTLASSGTNCHAYQVWMWAKRLIVSSNRWSMELAQVPSADRDWLVADSVHVMVNEPLWVEYEPQT